MLTDRAKSRAAAVFAGVGVLMGASGLTYGVARSIGVGNAINSERAHNIGAGCREQNRRHDDTVIALDRLLVSRLTGRSPDPKASPASVERSLAAALTRASPAVARQASTGRASTVLLINALAPRQDCAALVAAQVKN